MALFLELDTLLADLPPLANLLDELDQVFGTTVQLSTEQALDLDCGVRRASWCPWPDERVEMFITGATTRGADIILEKASGALRIRVCLKPLSTWTDWQLGVEAACALSEMTHCPAIQVTGEMPGLYEAEELRQRLLDEDDDYWRECEDGAQGIRSSIINHGEIVRIGGPSGIAAIGPRTWDRRGLSGQDPEQLSELLLEAIRHSIEARGFEGFHLANPMILDGRSGQSVVAQLIAPDRATLLRDPEFILLSADLESGAGSPLYLLPFEDLERAFPGRLSWLDDRNCALAAIPATSWTRHIEEIRPMLAEVDSFLAQHQPTEAAPEASSANPSATVRRWLPRKFW
ncbi:MAG: hypothetical protein CMP23_03150 [Rickettsiales bacterium]|nr:hypothetical protein [Rickettsiales bacterium]|tara:strand:+ start:2462 stop:3496 length:1035 start_codon:yes stop_codon:yes gene_type:complete